MCVTREEHLYKCLRFRKYTIISLLSESIRFREDLPVPTANFTTGYTFTVPIDQCLWGLGVNYPVGWGDGIADGQVQIGANSASIPVQPGTMFNLDRDEFPCLVGPLQIFIGENPILEVGQPFVRWYAILAEA